MKVMGNVGLWQASLDVVKVRYLAGGVDLHDYVISRRAVLSDDFRILPHNGKYEEQDGARLMEMMEPQPDFVLPIMGPKTARFLAQTVYRAGSTFLTRHHRWARESGVTFNDRNVYEHEVLSLALHYAIAWDHLQIGNSASLELIARRLQLIEEAVGENPAQPSWDGARLFMGMVERRGGAVMAPTLRAFVAGEMAKEAAILKERRKAREAAGAASAKGQGLGLGQDGPAAQA